MVWAATPLSFSVTMSEAVIVTGTPRLELDVGGVTRYATYASGSTSPTLTFTYTPQAGDIDLDGVTLVSPLDLNSGTITDLAGNNAALTYTLPDTTGVKVDYPSLAMDFVGNDYILEGAHYGSFPAFLTAAGGSFARASVATYYDASGVLQTASAGTPRFDHDPTTLAAKGILIESTRGNLLSRSEQFNVWGAYGAIARATDAALSPAGTMTAETITQPNAIADYLTNSGTITLSANTAYTVSLFFKPGTRTTDFGLMIDDNNWVGLRYAATYTYATNTVTTSGSGAGRIISTTVTALQNGWYRMAMSFTSNTTVGPLVFYVGRVGTGTGTTHIWGAQFEQGAFATSYIPTVAASVTRLLDSLSVPVAGWFSATEGTVKVEAQCYGVVAGGVGSVFALNDNSGANRVDLRAVQQQAYFTTGGVNTVLSPLSFPAGVTRKVSMVYSASVAAASLAGAAALTGTPRLPSGVTKLWIGNIDAGSYGLNGHISSFRYYPHATTLAQLPLLSQ